MRGALVAIVVITLMLGVACRESEDDQPPPASVTPTPEVSLVGVHAELADFMEGIQDVTFRVVLERKAPADIAGNRVVILNSPDGTRIDTIPVGMSEPVTSLIEDADGGGVISCEDGPANWRCFEIESLGRSVLRTAAPVTFFPAWELETYTVDELEGRTVVGREARCFRIETPDEDIVEYCFTPDGVPVYSSPQFGTYEAVEISDVVSNEAFTLPTQVE